MKETNSNPQQFYVILFNCQEDIEHYEEIDQQLQKTDFRTILKQKFKESVKHNEQHLSIISPSFKLYCGTKTGEATSIEIDIYGREGLVKIIELAKEHTWKVFDKQLNQFIDL